MLKRLRNSLDIWIPNWIEDLKINQRNEENYSSMISNSATWGKACHVIQSFSIQVFILWILSYNDYTKHKESYTSEGQWIPKPGGQS